MHAIYDYLFITDSEEGLILVDIDTLSDFEPRNNKLTRKITWNEGCLSLPEFEEDMERAASITSGSG